MTERRVMVHGVSMAYWDEGDSEQPVLVYVHGNTGGKIWFERAMRVAGYRVVVPDLPNFGDSDHIAETEIDRYADFLKGFLSSLSIETCYMVGHSLGGAVAISLAVRYPGVVQRLFLVDSAALDGLHTPEEYYPVIERYRSDRSLMRNALAGVTPTLNDDTLLDRLTDNAMKMNGDAFVGHPRSLDAFDYRERAHEVETPVLVARGTLDALITEEMARETADRFLHGTFLSLDGVGHSVMVESPDRFIRLVEEFGRR